MKKSILIFILLLLTIPGFGKTSQKERLLFSFEELKWAPHVASQRVEITQAYEIKWFQNKKLIKKQRISKEHFHAFETSVLSALLEEKVRRPSQAKCNSMLKVHLYHRKENVAVCRGNFRAYFKLHPLIEGLK
ncbi:MAG: hypothetical protein HYY62_00965 [Deltaproteobacteria bacterium]|nr:hypothetical protein [Deltaproteobacteria bacterium]